MLVLQIVSGKFAETEQAAVARNGVETHAAAKLFKELVIGMRHRVGEIHVLAAADFEHGVARNYVFFQRCKSNRRLDGGAWNRAIGVSKLLIDDGEDAAGVGIDGDDGTVVTAKSFDGGCANDGIVVGGNVSQRGINALFAWNVTMVARGSRGTRLCGGRGSFGRRRANATGGKEKCERCFSKPVSL